MAPCYVCVCCCSECSCKVFVFAKAVFPRKAVIITRVGSVCVSNNVHDNLQMCNLHNIEQILSLPLPDITRVVNCKTCNTAVFCTNSFLRTLAKTSACLHVLVPFCTLLPSVMEPATKCLFPASHCLACEITSCGWDAAHGHTAESTESVATVLAIRMISGMIVVMTST